MKFKKQFKKLLKKLSPTYRKLCAIQDEQTAINKRLVTFYDEMVRALDAATNQCWSIRHQTLQLKQQVDALGDLRAKLIADMSAQKEYRTVSRNMQWLAIQNNTLSIESAQKKFWRNYPVSQDFLRLVQTANLYVLECLKTVCDENDLHVWLHGGTLIGALRNNGFIPWDDDMDVGMTREDLELLCKILKNSNKYAIEYLYHDDNTFSRAYQFKLKDKQLPNYIDIFVFDKCAVFDGQKGCTAKLSEIRSIRAQLVNAYTKSNNKVTAIDIGYWHFGPLTDKDKQTADTLINSYLAKLGNVYKGNAYYYSIENYPFPYPVILEERMFPLKKIKFEKIEFYIPNDPEYYLDGYGDIWQMPADIGKHPHLYYYEPYAEQIEKFLMKKNYKID